MTGSIIRTTGPNPQTHKIINMKHIPAIILGLYLLLAVHPVFSQPQYPVLAEPAETDEVINQLSEEYMPVIGVWNMRESELQPEGYQATLDQASEHSPFNLLIPFLRFADKEIADKVVHDAVRGAAEYGLKKNIVLAPDLDVRNARRAFQRKYPDELQQLLRLREVSLSAGDRVETSLTTIDNLSDHYSGGRIPKYDALKSDLLRVVAYQRSEDGILPESIEEITDACELVYSAEDSVRISLPAAVGPQTHACAMVAFTLFYPDVFAPHLMDFQRELIDQYADVPLAGACKDEWGFPPYFPRYAEEGTVDFWYSGHRARVYAEKTGGKDLLEDCLLMALGMAGKETERQVAINHFREMSLQRNVALEEEFYDAVKETFGPLAAVTVHPTWWPYPDKQEMRKNGLDWWAVKRDWAQTDEIVPFGVRTAMSKKWGSPIWYNMYYTNVFSDQMWSSALGGGRLDWLSFQRMYDPELMRGQTRIRLLNAVSRSPQDCPVAIIFGHPGAMNWAGPHFDDVGMPLLNLFWNAGYPADLIPTSEIDNGSLQIDEEGWVCYGKQRYAAVVLYHPELDKTATSEFFLNARDSKTALFRVGDWTRDFYGKPVDETSLLPATMAPANDYRDAYLMVLDVIREQGIPPQTPATEDLDETYYTLRDFHEVSKFPPTTGFCRLIDGTVIHVAGTHDISGDPIRREFMVNGHPVSVDAVGVAAVRLNEAGELQALAAGSLKSFSTGTFELNLDEPVDMALWVDDTGAWKGLLQGWQGPVPGELLKITEEWDRVKIPTPPENPFGRRQ